MTFAPQPQPVPWTEPSKQSAIATARKAELSVAASDTPKRSATSTVQEPEPLRTRWTRDVGVNTTCQPLDRRELVKHAGRLQDQSDRCQGVEPMFSSADLLSELRKAKRLRYVLSRVKYMDIDKICYKI